MGGEVKRFTRKVTRAVRRVGRSVRKAVKYVFNVAKGIVKNLGKAVEGILEGDWEQFKEGVLGTLETGLYVLGGVFGVITQNYWLVAAAMVALDGQHNQGQLTYSIVKEIGRAETNIFGTDNIKENAELIAMSITMVSSLATSIAGISLLAKLPTVASIMSQYSSYINTAKIALGTYSIYEAYNKYQEAKDLYDELMAEYQEFMAEISQKVISFNKMWDSVYGNLNLWYSAMPGGNLFNAAAGSTEYSISSINEQCAYCLALDTKRDYEIEQYYYNPMNIDYVNLNIDDIKPQILR